MQKRTNPLALKGEKTESDIRKGVGNASVTSASASRRAMDYEPRLSKTATVVPHTEKPAAPSVYKTEGFSTAKSVKMASGATITYEATSKGVVATRVECVEPEPADTWIEEIVAEEPEIVLEEVAEPAQEENIEELVQMQEEAEPAPEVAPAPAPAADMVIEDEEEFPTLDDFKAAVRFSIRGQNSRKLIVGKVSRDVLRLAQLMHPDEKISTIVENALLTRIFLENPEAFDAMAVVIEENGGRIKC